MTQPGATDPHYTQRLLAYESRWKRLIGAQLPYRWNVRRVTEGRVLEVGCGVGRNLGYLDDAVGVDTNRASIDVARSRGYAAYTVDEFLSDGASHVGGFDTILFAHVLEHMSNTEASDLVTSYLPYLRNGGRVVVIVPQPAGFHSDPTHVDPVGPAEITRIADGNRLQLERIFSFPLPMAVGRWFRHNETVALLRSMGTSPR